MRKEEVDIGEGLRAQPSWLRFLLVLLVGTLAADFLPKAIVAIFGVWRHSFTDTTLLAVDFSAFLILGLLIMAFKKPLLTGIVIAGVLTVLVTYHNFFSGSPQAGLSWLPIYISPCVAVLFQGWLIQKMGDWLEVPWICNRRSAEQSAG